MPIVLCLCSLLSDEFKVMQFAQQLVAIAQYYRFDGWLVNIENDIHVSGVFLACVCMLMYTHTHTHTHTANVIRESLHVTFTTYNWHARCLSRVKGHLVRQCDHRRQTKMAKPTEPVKQVCNVNGRERE